jgi:hypothetical protein
LKTWLPWWIARCTGGPPGDPHSKTGQRCSNIAALSGPPEGIITLPSGGLIVTAPKQTVTVRNDDTQETADFVITGIFLASGNFSFTFDTKGNPILEFDLGGPGNVIDVCAALS